MARRGVLWAALAVLSSAAVQAHTYIDQPSDKAASAYQRAGKNEEADRLARELHQRYPNYAGG